MFCARNSVVNWLTRCSGLLSQRDGDDDVAPEEAMVVVEAVIDAAEILIGVEDLIVGADEVQRDFRPPALASSKFGSGMKPPSGTGSSSGR